MPKKTLQIVSKTWTRDAYDLFDYETENIQLKRFQSKIPCSLVRHKGKLFLHKLLGSDESLVTVEQKKGDYYLNAAGGLWQVLKYLKPAQSIISEGDSFKFGRVTFTIKSVATANGTPVETLSEEGCCRVCFAEETEEDNPLIAPCACTGSLKVIHFDCLKKWFAIRQTSGDSPHWRSLGCEICKSQYPFALNVSGTQLNLFDVGSQPTLIVECSVKNHSTGIYAISFGEKTKLRLGRGTDSDIRINDISVSREHALLRYRHGQFYVEDSQSKFGTLKLMQGPVKVEKTLHFQAGRSLLTYSVAQG